MKRILLGMLPILLTTVAPRGALCQSSYGGGVSGGIGSMDAELVREYWGPPDSIRLVAVVLFRGQPMADVTRIGAESELSHKMMDSLSRDANRRGVWAGGSVTPRADQWIEFDPKSRTLRTQGREWRATARDSVLVVFVDQTVADKPVISTTSVASPAEPDASRLPGADLTMAMMEQAAKWEARLLADPAVRNFVRRR